MSPQDEWQKSVAGQFDHFNFLLAFLFTLEMAADTSSPSVEFAILNQVFCVARDFWTYNAASVSSTYPSQSVGSSVQTSILSLSLSPHKASRRHCGGRRDG